MTPEALDEVKDIWKKAYDDVASGSTKYAEETARGTANAAQYNKLKWTLKTKEAANDLVESLQKTGQLPSNYITKVEVAKHG